ncbi:PP2C family protein-serine/threonine phosphatase [Meiothermus ruber]|uniref:Protein serine/threonine phosphatase n=1 Tax=Meiothermus ruber (strain ATCC 35948 / DSM 1279 / VKM B-1258 / 21) TaxID=504728 RepID=D3PMS4_MEIRD|nr:PP2C family serine/threonine-protein phosphatase [Meiothermus ruber]ADD27249.1 protein serine/threonine phosphatase [Meiothermus ruber DSM 1279]AGK03701.1 protein serine/threonine phosphatase [Meiothermus ruber DSM 1279]MCL6530027.1 protein phosphatase 2C domain-containing protein [Meiothermus ruber]
MPGSDSLPMVFTAALTDPGRKRALNEDAVTQLVTPYGGIFIVADGMGGHRTGEVASQMAVSQILEILRHKEPSPQGLLEAYEAANEAIYLAGQKPESRGMGTTCTTLWLDLPYALIAHVGDSRAYLLRDGELMQLTQDHSWVADRVRQGLLSEEEARNHRWRNVITNALGSFSSARVDLVGLKVRPGDVFLLCSDGLSGVLEDRVLAEMILTNPPEPAVVKLVKLANDWGGPDNISAVVVTIGSQVAENPRPYALPLEASEGRPVRLQSGSDPEVLTTQIVEPERKVTFWQRWGSLILLLLWFGLLGFVLFNQFGTGSTP